jgi:hypothetical protein
LRDQVDPFSRDQTALGHCPQVMRVGRICLRLPKLAGLSFVTVITLNSILFSNGTEVILFPKPVQVFSVEKITISCQYVKVSYKKI